MANNFLENNHYWLWNISIVLVILVVEFAVSPIFLPHKSGRFLLCTIQTWVRACLYWMQIIHLFCTFPDKSLGVLFCVKQFYQEIFWIVLYIASRFCLCFLCTNSKVVKLPLSKPFSCRSSFCEQRLGRSLARYLKGVSSRNGKNRTLSFGKHS